MSYLSSSMRFILCSLVLLLVAQTAQAADLAGKWRFVLSNYDGDFPRTISLEVEGEKVTGKLGNEMLKGTYKDGQLELSGKHYAGEAGYESTLTLSGKFEGEQLKGDAKWDSYSLTFVATRTA